MRTHKNTDTKATMTERQECKAAERDEEVLVDIRSRVWREVSVDLFVDLFVGILEEASGKMLDALHADPPEVTRQELFSACGTLTEKGWNYVEEAYRDAFAAQDNNWDIVSSLVNVLDVATFAYFERRWLKGELARL